MGLVVGAGRSARLIVARDKLDMTASGQKATSTRRHGLSAPPPIADIAPLHAQVRFVPDSEVDR